MVPVSLQVIPAQPLGLVQLVLVDEVEDVDQFRRQPGEKIQPLPGQLRLLLPAGALFQVDERLQAGLQCRV